jgi:hypothetical protein
MIPQPIKNYPDTVFYLDDILGYLVPTSRRMLEKWLNGKSLELKEDREIIPWYMLERFFDTIIQKGTRTKTI